jgi:hypothetical protein
VKLHEARGEIERESGGSTTTITLVFDLPKALQAPAMVLLRLLGGMIEGVREIGKRGKMATRGCFQRGTWGFIPTDGFGLWCTVEDHHWSSWAVVWGGTVS